MKRLRFAVLLGLSLPLGIAWAACSSDDTSTSSGGATSAASTTGAGGTGGAGGAAATSTTTSTTSGSTTSTASAGGAGGVGGSTSSSGGGSGGEAGAPPVDAGPPDVDFSYDANAGDGAVSADSACAAAVAQADKLPVDIIWAVDTSGSMSEEIAQIVTNINTSFVSIIAQSGLDYRVIMIADKGTGSFQVCANPPLGGPNCGDNYPLFRGVDQTIGSTNSLSLLLSTYGSATPALNWSTSLRYSAVKVFVEVTDDNSSLSGASFDTQLLALQPAGMFGTAAQRNYVFHSIIGVSAGNPAVKCASAVNTGSQYQYLSNLTGGTMNPVCAADYSPIFNAIANGIVGQLACTFSMPQGDGGALDPNNVGMTYTPTNGMPANLPHVSDVGQCVGDGWYYDDNANPTQLLLCPASCTTAKADPGGQIQILVGCVPS